MSLKSISTLFITYDGLLDPLGGSQILPYILSIASHPRPLHIVSFEKPDRFQAGAYQLRLKLIETGINWTPLSFTTRLGKLGKLWDLLRMHLVCLRLQYDCGFGIVHCRSYQAMQVGKLLNRLTGVKTIFDMRGLWVDERVDGGLWKQDSWLNRLMYKIYKRIEKDLLYNASHVVVLTERVVPELYKLSPEMTAQITVIPCCADFDHFVDLDDVERESVRKELGVEPSTLLLSYLGSLGTWYLLDEMLHLFAEAAKQSDNVQLLLITKDWRNYHETLLKDLGLQHLRPRIHVVPANRDRVPKLLGASDIMLSLIKPAYSKMASSPTKLAEAFSLGIPVISNTGVGDVDQITIDLDAGSLIDLSDPQVFKKLAAELDKIRSKGGSCLRIRARKRFGLEVAAKSYHKVYASLDCGR